MSNLSNLTNAEQKPAEGALELYLKTLGLNSRGEYSQKLLEKKQETFYKDVDEFFKIHSAKGYPSFDDALISSKLLAGLTKEKKQAIIQLGKNKGIINEKNGVVEILPYFTTPEDFPKKGEIYRLEDKQGRGPFHEKSPGRSILDAALEKDSTLFSKVSDILEERGAIDRDYAYGTQSLTDLENYFGADSLNKLKESGYSVKKYNYDATGANPDQLFFEKNQIVVDRNLMSSIEKETKKVDLHIGGEESLIGKSSTSTEDDLIKQFDKNISTGGGEVSGVYTLKNDPDKVVRVKPYATVVSSSEVASEQFLKDASNSELFPKNVMKTHSVSHFTNGASSTTYRVMEKAVGSTDFTKAAPGHLAQLIKDIAILSELGLQVDPKPRNMLYNEVEGFKIFDVGPSTLHLDSKGNPQTFEDFLSGQDKNINKHLNTSINSAYKYLGGKISREELTASLLNKQSNVAEKITEPSFQLTSPTEESILRNTAIDTPTEKQTIYNNPLQGSFDFNAEIKRRVTGNERIPVTNVVEEVTLPTWLPKAPITTVEDQSKQQESILKNAELLREQKRVEQAEALRLKNEASIASAVQTQTMNTGNIQDHANNRRSFSDLSKANLFSFDTETSGVNPKTAQIWQYGYAERLADSSSFTGSNYHVNPFGNKSLVAQDLIDMNGDFSKKAFKQGNFTGILQDAVSGLLEKNTHTGGLLETLARVNTGSILVMQNMDFENNLLREAFERGDYKQSVFTDLQNKMATSVLDSRLERTNNLLQRPSSVEGIMREADFTYHTQFSKYRDESSFKKYAGLLNQAFDEYDSIIKTTTSTSKIPVIELMDISKTFLANLGANNLIEKETSMLGLNIDFLTRSFYGRVEDHTAFSDSRDTIELFEDMFRHTKDMRNGIITDELKELAGRIKGNQAGEVNRRFVASVSSTIQDFITRGYTKGRASKDSYYTPEQILRDNETNKIRDLPKISIGTKAKQTVTSLEEALNAQIAKYQDMYVDDIDGFSRQGFVKDLLSLFDEEAKNYEDVKTKMNSIVIPSTNSNTVQGSSIVAKKEGVLASTFNSKNSKVVMGLAAVAGLGYMAFAPGPKQIEEQNQDLPVYSNFYDEQYLGTGFVEFRERNKRYVY